MFDYGPSGKAKNAESGIEMSRPSRLLYLDILFCASSLLAESDEVLAVAPCLEMWLASILYEVQDA